MRLEAYGSRLVNSACRPSCQRRSGLRLATPCVCLDEVASEGCICRQRQLQDGWKVWMVRWESSCSIAPILHLLHSAAIRSCHFLDVTSQNAMSPGPCIRHCPTCVGQQLKYAHSTLHGHALAGEERFAVEWHKEDDSVW